MEKHGYPARRWVMEQLLSLWRIEWDSEMLSVDEAAGRVPSEDQYARYSIPVVRASSMDGVGVRSADFTEGIPDTSGWQLGREFVRADTGDDFDDRYDAVIRIEDVTLDAGGKISIHPDVKVRPGLGVRPSGSMLKKNDLLVKAGRPLRPVDLAALVMGGIQRLPVYRKPRVAFIPTGSELIPAGAPLERGTNIDSNSILVKHLLLEMGAVPVLFPIVRDERKNLEEALESGLEQADIVILNGGSSKGDEDFNARILEERGHVICHGVAAAPGKPMCAAMVGGKPVINVPGPPAAVFYGMDWCIRGLIYHLLHLPMPLRQTVEGVLTEPIQAPSDMEILCKIDAHKKADGSFEVAQVPFRASSVVENLCSNAMYVTKLGLDGHGIGERIAVELLLGEEYFTEEP